ncbi:MAG: hypothetical protein ACJA0C_000540 [Candidatus Endobugula sp.]|jgi:hypothetical protein
MYIKKQSFSLYTLLAIFFFLVVSGCSSKFPNPKNSEFKDVNGISGQQLFLKTFRVHGGDAIDELNDVNVGITGKWKTLITKIQPLVTDFKFRVDSQEKILTKEFVYAALYTGPSGNKKVVRTPYSLEVFYNLEPSLNADVISTTALTADAFYTFLLGPLALHRWKDSFTRIEDKVESGNNYHRIYLLRKPGFGFSEADEVVLWIDAATFLTTKVQITLEGHSTTRGAHVQVNYLNYVKVENYIFPSNFYEKVNAPISIGAHTWRLTGIDINRGLRLKDVDSKGYSSRAGKPAKPIK